MHTNLHSGVIVPDQPAHKKTAHEPRSLEGAKPALGKKMVYETSAGGVVLRHIHGVWQVAIIEPNIINADTTNRRTKSRPEGTVFALPKGGVDEGETPEQSADREVFEETGVRGRLLFRLTTIRYLYQRSWGGREHVSKAVSFYLFLYHSGRLGQISPEMRDEVRKAFWFPLDKAHRKLTYRGEREVLKMAQKIVREQPERLTPPPPTEWTSGPMVPRPQAQQRSASQRFVWTSRNPAPSRGRPASGGAQAGAQARASAPGTHRISAPAAGEKSAGDKKQGSGSKAGSNPASRAASESGRTTRGPQTHARESSRPRETET
jgi:ADP-ribose pyrophosphatase YjhB (NUDIX family)